MEMPSIIYDVKDRIWITTNDYAYVDDDYVIIVPAGFKFNLASVPRILWFVISPYELSIPAPLVHDYLYVNKGRIGNRVYSRRDADKIFKRLMGQMGVGKFRRFFGYISVRAFGWLYWYDVKIKFGNKIIKEF